MNEEKYTQLLEDGELFSYIEDLQQIIDKAIEYIKENNNSNQPYIPLDLLEILKGDPNDKTNKENN